eukprot:928331-Amphidinium_carterae.1
MLSGRSCVFVASSALSETQTIILDRCAERLGIHGIIEGNTVAELYLEGIALGCRKLSEWPGVSPGQVREVQLMLSDSRSKRART